MANIQTDNQPAPILPKPEEIPVPPEPTPKKSKLSFILLGIFLILLIIASAFFVIKSLRKTKVTPQAPVIPQITVIPTQVTDETVNWKTYKDEKLGFEIKYPPQFKTSENISNLNQKVISFDDGDTCSKNNLYFYINYNNDSPLDQKLLITSETVLINPFINTLDTYELPNNDQCIVLGKSKSGDRLRKVTSFNNSGVNWTIGAIINKSSYDSESALFNQILSTFKLLEQTSNNLTSDWKSYESKRFKFSFKYPQDLVLDNRYENNYPDQGGINLYSKEDYAAVISEEPRGGGSFIELWVYSNPQNLSALDWMKKDTAHSNYFDQGYSTINIAGETGYIYVTEGMGAGFEAILSKNGQIYMFADMGYDNELKQIISTFKFI